MNCWLWPYLAAVWTYLNTERQNTRTLLNRHCNECLNALDPVYMYVHMHMYVRYYTIHRYTIRCKCPVRLCPAAVSQPPAKDRYACKGAPALRSFSGAHTPAREETAVLAAGPRLRRLERNGRGEDVLMHACTVAYVPLSSVIFHIAAAAIIWCQKYVFGGELRRAPAAPLLRPPRVGDHDSCSPQEGL